MVCPGRALLVPGFGANASIFMRRMSKHWGQALLFAYCATFSFPTFTRRLILDTVKPNVLPTSVMRLLDSVEFPRHFCQSEQARFKLVATL